MHRNNSNYCEHKVHVNPVFNYLTHKYAYSSASSTNRHSTKMNQNPHASEQIENKDSITPLNDFIGEKCYKLSTVMHRNSINRAAMLNQESALPKQNQNSKYKWENQKPASICDTSSGNASVPFHSVFSKGWFFHNSCDTRCVADLSLDLQSCCFINKLCLPQNTLSMPDFKKRVLDFYKKKVSSKGNNSLISISKHKLIKKTDAPAKESVVKLSSQKRKSPGTPVLCTRSKLIRKSKPVSVSMALVKSEKLIKNLNKNFIIKRHSLVRINNSTEDIVKTVHKRKRFNSSRSSSSSVVVLTKRKLIRKSTPIAPTTSPFVSVSKPKLRRKIEENLLPLVSISKHKLSRAVVQKKEAEKSTEAEKLISINPNKLIRSSLLPKITKSKSDAFFSNSVLRHVIRYRRRIHRGSGYVLLTRNKLIKKAKFKNKIWRNNKSEEVTPKNRFNKMFVSLGNNKLIRKSLFVKTNKNDPEKNSIPISSAKNALFARMLNSPSRRIQRFTNHMTRTKLRFTSGLDISLVRNRFTDKHKNDKKIYKRKKNTVCPVYRKKGTCSKLLKGECFRIHDRKYVALCQNFIRNTCDEKDCLLSHDCSSKKISMCRRYLRNSCNDEGCLYVHAKPTLETPICPQFLQGYCENGEMCTKWHIFACPEFKQNSTCSKKETCRLPHRDLNYFLGKFDESDDEDGLNWRYFEKNKIDDRDNKSISIIPERQSLGDLPEYIPI